jgi:hypothetical protein
MKTLIEKAIRGEEDVTTLPVVVRGLQQFVCYEGTAYELARFHSADATMTPVIRHGHAFVTIAKTAEFGTIVNILHICRPNGNHPRAGRWFATFVRSSSWLYELELGKSNEEINSAVAAWLDDGGQS